jgi:hypothetical protein
VSVTIAATPQNRVKRTAKLKSQPVVDKKFVASNESVARYLVLLELSKASTIPMTIDIAHRTPAATAIRGFGSRGLVGVGPASGFTSRFDFFIIHRAPNE